MILPSKTLNLQHLNLSHHVLIASGQTILQKNVGVVPMPLTDPNDTNRSIQQTIEMMGKNKKPDPSRTFINPQKLFKLKKLRLQWAD